MLWLFADDVATVAVVVESTSGSRRASPPTQHSAAARHHDRSTAASAQHRPTVAQAVSAVVHRLQRCLLADLHALTIRPASASADDVIAAAGQTASTYWTGLILLNSLYVLVFYFFLIF